MDGVPRYTRAHEVQVARASPGRGRSVYAAASGKDMLRRQSPLEYLSNEQADV
jgi:hypothetical protein